MDTEQLAYNAFIVGLVLTAIASVCYVALPLWPRVAYRKAATDAGTTMTVASRGEAPSWLGQAATATLYLAIAALFVSLAARWIAAERPPYANMWEFTIAFGCAILLFYAIFEWWARHDEEGSAQAQTIGAFVVPVALALFLVSLAFFPSEIKPLIAPLRSNRILGAHVATMILAYASLTASFGAAAIYLIQGEGAEPRFPRLPHGEALDEFANRSVLVGFPLLALGIALGAWWANSAWSRYWGWDPKETAALVTWLIYAAYLHARNLRGWRGKRSAWILIIGFGAVMFTYFGVNLWVSGLHSYSGV
jgi:cytochrome c-type biogenesis protein CcsB